MYDGFSDLGLVLHLQNLGSGDVSIFNSSTRSGILKTESVMAISTKTEEQVLLREGSHQEIVSKLGDRFHGIGVNTGVV